MGYYLEVNTLVRLPVETDFSALGIGQKLIIQRERERLVPLHIALLFIDKDWNFYGYCRVNWLEVKNKATKMEVEILSLFNENEKNIYKEKFIEAGKITEEV